MIYLIPVLLSFWGLIYFKNRKSPYVDILYWFICLSLILIFGLRYRVGGDTLNYMLKYDLIPEISQLSLQNLLLFNVEPGFVILCGLAKQFFNSFYPVQIIVSCLVNISIFYYAKKHIGSNFLFSLLYCILLSFYYNTEIMREGCAVSFFLIALLQYKKGKTKMFYLWMLPAMFFHYSSLFFLVFPVFIKYITTPKKAFLFGLVAILLLSTFTLPIFTGYLGSKLQGSAAYKLTIWGQLVILLKYIIFPYVILKFVKRRYKSDDYLDIQIFLSVYIFFAILVLGPYSILMRLMNYLNPVFLVIVVFCFSNVFKQTIKVTLVRLFTLVCLYLFYLSPYLKDTSKITEGTHFYCLWFPYYSIFDEQINNNRETFVRAQFDEIGERNY